MTGSNGIEQSHTALEHLAGADGRAEPPQRGHSLCDHPHVGEDWARSSESDKAADGPQAEIICSNISTPLYRMQHTTDNALRRETHGNAQDHKPCTLYPFHPSHTDTAYMVGDTDGSYPVHFTRLANCPFSRSHRTPLLISPTVDTPCDGTNIVLASARVPARLSVS